jgi:Nucleotidyl transferase AbiEii toxin, Type IV TA system
MISTRRSQLELMVLIIHRLSDQFREHAILKGGMEMALFSSQRETNDVDFVFVPCNSKKKIAIEIEDCLKSLDENVQVTTELSSKNVRFRVKRCEVLVIAAGDGSGCIVRPMMADQLSECLGMHLWYRPRLASDRINIY